MLMSLRGRYYFSPESTLKYDYHLSRFKLGKTYLSVGAVIRIVMFDRTYKATVELDENNMAHTLGPRAWTAYVHEMDRPCYVGLFELDILQLKVTLDDGKSI